MNSTAFLTSMTTDDIMTTLIASGDLLLLLNDEQRKRNLVVVAALAVVAVVGVVGNGLVLVVYNPRWSRARLSPATIFILVMAGLDLGSCLLSVPYEMADLLQPYDYDNIPLCRAHRSVTTLMSEARGMLLLCVACDRYLRFCSPLVSYTSTQAKVVVAIVIALSMVVAWPQAVLNGHITIATHKDGVLGTDCGILPTVPARYSLFYHTVISFIFAVCFTAYALLYGRIFYVLWRKGLFSSDRLSNRKSKSSKPVTFDHRHGEGFQVNEHVEVCKRTFTDRFVAEGIDSRRGSQTCYGGYKEDPVSSTPDPDNQNQKSKEMMDLASPTHRNSGSTSEKLTSSSGDNSDTLNPRLLAVVPQKDVSYDSATSEELRLNPDQDAEPSYAMHQRCFRCLAVGDDSRENCEALVRDHVTNEHGNLHEIESKSTFGLRINSMHFARCDVVNDQGREEPAYNLDDSQRVYRTCGSARGAKSCVDTNKPSRGLHHQSEILELEQNASLWSARAEVEHAPLDSELIHANILECSPFSDRARTFHRYNPMQENQRQASILNNNTSGDKSTTAQPAARNNDRPQALAHDSTSGNGIRRHGGRRLCLSKTTLMLATVTLATVLGYVPYLTVVILRTAGIRFVRDTSSTGDVVYMFCIRSYFLSNFVNPIVYYFVNSKFKMKLHAVLRRVCCCCCSSSPSKENQQPDVAASKLNIFAVIPKIPRIPRIAEWGSGRFR